MSDTPPLPAESPSVDTEELKRLLEAMSPAPWTWNKDDPRDNSIESGNGGCVCWIQPHGHLPTAIQLGEEFSAADLHGICAAVNSLPALLEEVGKLKGAAVRFLRVSDLLNAEHMTLSAAALADAESEYSDAMKALRAALSVAGEQQNQ